jgi:hypothetical protein
MFQIFGMSEQVHAAQCRLHVYNIIHDYFKYQGKLPGLLSAKTLTLKLGLI